MMTKSEILQALEAITFETGDLKDAQIEIENNWSPSGDQEAEKMYWREQKLKKARNALEALLEN